VSVKVLTFTPPVIANILNKTLLEILSMIISLKNLKMVIEDIVRSWAPKLFINIPKFNLLINVLNIN
jgi:hypothetical protein